MNAGAVFFDDARPGPGWACRAGGQPWRIASQHDLDSETVWLTNITWMTGRKYSLFEQPRFRPAEYLRTSLLAIKEEWALADAGPDEASRLLAGIFARIRSIARERLDIEDFHGNSLRHDLAAAHDRAEYPVGDQIPAVAGAWQTFSRTQVRQGDGAIVRTLRYPRLDYALTRLCSEEPHGPWRWVEGRDLPERSRQRAWLNSLDEPVIARIVIEKADAVYGDLVAFGGGGGGGGPKQRSWASHPELLMLAEMCELRIDGAWIGAGYRPPEPGLMSTASGLDDIFYHVSYSAGLLAENLWGARLLEESVARGPGPKRQALRAVWSRAADRLAMFLVAAELYNLDYAVVSYGMGSLRIALEPGAEADLAADALSFGLQPPLAMTADAPVTILERDWGGNPKGYLESAFRAHGDRQSLAILDSLSCAEKAERSRLIEQVSRHLQEQGRAVDAA